MSTGNLFLKGLHHATEVMQHGKEGCKHDYGKKPFTARFCLECGKLRYARSRYKMSGAPDKVQR